MSDSPIVHASTAKPGLLTLNIEIGTTNKWVDIHWTGTEAQKWENLSNGLRVLSVMASIWADRLRADNRAAPAV